MRISDWSSDVCSSDLKRYGECPFFRIPVPLKGYDLGQDSDAIVLYLDNGQLVAFPCQYCVKIMFVLYPACDPEEYADVFGFLISCQHLHSRRFISRRNVAGVAPCEQIETIL